MERAEQKSYGDRTAAFFCYADDGANEEDKTGVPKKLQHREWFDAKEQPFRGTKDGDRLAYPGLVWQCRYSVEVPDDLWAATKFGRSRPYADDQAADMEQDAGALKAFDRWTGHFIRHVRAKGIVPGTEEAEKSARTTTNTDKVSAAGLGWCCSHPSISLG